MSKKPNLAAIVEAAGSTRRTAAPAQAEPPAGAPNGSQSKARTRRATKQVAAHFPEEVSWQLRQLAAERRASVQSLLGEALNDLFRKYGKPELAPTEPGRAA